MTITVTQRLNFEELTIFPSRTVHGNIQFSLKVFKIFSVKMQNNCHIIFTNSSYTKSQKYLYPSTI